MEVRLSRFVLASSVLVAFSLFGFSETGATLLDPDPWVGTYEATGGDLVPEEAIAALCGDDVIDTIKLERTRIVITFNYDAVLQGTGEYMCNRPDGRSAHGGMGDFLFVAGRLVPADGAGARLVFDFAEIALQEGEAGSLVAAGGIVLQRTSERPDIEIVHRLMTEARRDSTWEARRRWADQVSLPYRCEDDPLLEASNPVPDERTTAFVSKWARGKRIAQEREIACSGILDGNMGETAGSHPIRGEPGFGSGRVWWSWWADFDGDRQADLFTLLVDEADPAARPVPVVILATGAIHEFDYGEVPTLFPAGLPISTCTGYRHLDVDALGLYWGGVLYYEGTEFRQSGCVKEY